MSTVLEDAQTAYDLAAKRLNELADEIDETEDDGEGDEKIAKFEEQFGEAKAEADRTLANLKKIEERQEARKLHQAPVSTTSTSPAPVVTVVKEERVYSRTQAEFRSRTLAGTRESFFVDLFDGVINRSPDALERIDRHQAEARALNETAGTGGEFVPPLWMQDQWVKLARASRPTADATNDMALPEGTNQINLPSVATGTTTAVQSDGGAVSSTDMTTSSVQAQVKTIAGQQDVARQLLDRSIPGIDQVIFDDLSRDYATRIDTQVLNGSGAGANATGILNVSGVNAVTYTDASPTVPELYSKLADAVQRIHANRFLPPSAIVMHPSRWGWFLASLDTANRPLITPYAPFNAAGQLERVASENIVGNLHGLPVIVDASVPTNLGAGVNQDPIIVARFEDLFLFEQPAPGITARTYDQTLSGTLQIRFQVYGYFAFLGNRYPKAISVINGTGLTAATF